MKILDIVEIKIQAVDFSVMVQHPWKKHETDHNCSGVTKLLRSIAVQSGKMTVQDEQDELPLRLLVGMGMEAILAQLYPDMTWQPGRLSFEGIEGHPDGLSTLTHPSIADPFYCNEEFKYTAKSIREKGKKADELKDVRAEWMWQRQQMSYCKLWSEELSVPVRHSRLHVVWAMNAYEKYTLDERYMRYLIEYSDEEIEGNWAMLKKQEATMMRMEEAGI